MSNIFYDRASKEIAYLKKTGQYKNLKSIISPMGPSVKLKDKGEVDCFCSNNYLGLANHPEVVEAGVEGLRRYGAGTASVRFICGSFDCHNDIESKIASFLGKESAYTFVSCWTANEAFFPTLCSPDDLILSDELNHACIIDGIRLASQIQKGIRRKVYKHCDLKDLEQKLSEAVTDCSFKGQIWIVTDGVFSMEGDIAPLNEIRKMCDKYGALLVVDDSHGTGVLGNTGRGTHEHLGIESKYIDFFTGTLGKALGGGAGGYVAGSKEAIDLLVQRGRPTIFSNALPATVAMSSSKAIDLIDKNTSLVQKLHSNVSYARKGIREAGFDVIQSPTAICPIIVGETSKSIAMSEELLDMGVFVIGFGYPVVPEGTARLRVQISAAHEKDHLDRLVESLKLLKKRHD